jgi:hypothetical protein
MNSKLRLQKITAMAIVFVFALWMVPAQASLKEIKKYKEAYPDTKPKCMNCHTDEKPKKEDGAHEANAYGKAVMDMSKEAKEEEISVESYKKVGSVEDFEAKTAK